MPNSFYTEGINELKKQTRVVKEPVKPVRKRSRGYEEQEEISFVGDQEEARSEQRDSNNWYPCVLPTNRVNVKVQFVLNVPEEVVPQVKKAEPAAPKTTKKSDPTTDLLSLFQKAIENVNEPEVPSRPT